MPLDNFIEGLEILKKHTKKSELERSDVHGSYDMVVTTNIDIASCTAEEIRRLNFLGFVPGEDGEMLENDIHQVLEEANMPVEEGQYFEWADLTDAQWAALKTCYYTDCFTYYT